MAPPLGLASAFLVFKVLAPGITVITWIAMVGYLDDFLLWVESVFPAGQRGDQFALYRSSAGFWTSRSLLFGTGQGVSAAVKAPEC